MTTQSPYRTRIAGTGSYLPEKLLTNKDLEKLVETNDEWIRERTGISSRHIAADDELTSDLAAKAALRAMEVAGITAKDLDVIICCTVTGDQVMPSTACMLQLKLGARNIMAFDLSAACSGFVYGVATADQFIRSGFAKHVLVVGAELLSRYMNFKDRETCILFGDGAGAAILSRTSSDDPNVVKTSHLRSDGSLGDLFVLPAGGSKIPFTQEVLDEGKHWVRMKGREIFKHAVRTMSDVCQEAIDANGMKIEEIDWLIPHQANLRIIDAVGTHFGIDPKKVVVNVQHTGNTSAATVPVALDEAVRDGRIKRGHNVLLTAFGAGLTSGAVMIKY